VNTPERAGWHANEERLLALVVLADHVGDELSSRAGEAFLRAFIVQNRSTGLIGMRFRFRYSDHDSWFAIFPKEQTDAFRSLREGIAHVVLTAAATMGLACSPLDVMSFEPPDDEGDFRRTIAWLAERDLIHAPRFVTDADSQGTP
jgi:hypothetical protein